MSGSFSVLTLCGRTWTVWLTDPGRGRVNPPRPPAFVARRRRESMLPPRGRCCLLHPQPRGHRVGNDGAQRNRENSANLCARQGCSGPWAARGLVGTVSSSSWTLVPGLPTRAVSDSLPQIWGPSCLQLPIVTPLLVPGTWEPGYWRRPCTRAPSGDLAPGRDCSSGGRGSSGSPIPWGAFAGVCGEVSLSYLHSDGALASLWDKMQIHPLRSPPQWRAFSALYCGLSFGDPRGWVRSGLAVEIVGG